MLIDVAELKNYIKKTDNAIDAILEDFASTASATMEDWVRQPIVVAPVVFEFVGHGGDTKVHGYHPAALTSLEYRSTPTDDWTAVDDSVMLMSPNDVPIAWYPTKFAVGRFYRLTMNVGYASDGVPTPLHDAALQMAAQAYFRWSEKRNDVDSMTESNQYLATTTKKYIRIDEYLKSQLRPYCRRGL